jgi:hypothetical protein
MENAFIKKYEKDIWGINSSFDREIITGSIIPISYAEGVMKYLSANGILLKDFTLYAETLAQKIKDNATSIAERENVHYQYLNSSKIKKDELIKSILSKRGKHPGLVAILSALEIENSFDIYRNKDKQKLEIVPRQRKCLHIYYYFIDEQLGLCHFRIQTFFPFKVQFYFNGKEKLANDFNKAGIEYQKDDNCFTWLSDYEKAQQIADSLDVAKLHSTLDYYAKKYVNIIEELSRVWHLSYHWSVKQVEYATDIMFKSEEGLNRYYNELVKQITLSTSPEDIMTFLGKKLKGDQAGKIQTSYKQTYLGIRVKHQNRNIIIKIYNKAGSVLRIEVTFNKASELRVIQEVHQKDGQTVKKLAPLKKSIYSLEHFIRFAKDATRRYLDFLNQMDDNSKGIAEINQFTERKTENDKHYKGFNPLNNEDNIIFQELLNGLFISTGFRNKDLKSVLSKRLAAITGKVWTTSKVCRLLKRLRVFGLLKRVTKTYKYFLTEKGRMILSLCVKLKNMTVIPTCDALLKSLSFSMA